MPRLLLVDDNPSIHKIAETLLASTDIQLVCVASAQEALNLVAQGERFDVALLDTTMAGMDGWQLLDQFRVHPATAGIPIAMMAGVLDIVDPVRLEKAHIQGFLKKPVELRDLGERIHKFLEARVEVAPPALEFSPFSTLPAVKLSDFPEFRQPSAPESLPESPAELALEVPETDLLILTAEDLWPEVAPHPGTFTEDLSLFAEIIPAEEPLDLEELDLDSLKGLTSNIQPAPTEVAILPTFEPLQAPVLALEPLPEFAPVFESFADETASAPTQVLSDEVDTQELPDLGPETEPTFDPSALAGLDSLSEEVFEPRPPLDFSLTPFDPDPDFLAGLGEASITSDVVAVDWSDESATMLGMLAPSQPSAASLPLEAPNRRRDDELDLGELELAAEPMPEPKPEHMPEPIPEPVPEPLLESAPVMSFPPAELAPRIPEATPLRAAVAAPSTPVPTGTGVAAEELLRAIAADPALLDQLAKALVAKLSDQVLREIAWEVMPEMAERLNRH